MWRTDLFAKTLMLQKIENGKRRGWQRMRWLDGITNSIDMKVKESEVAQSCPTLCYLMDCSLSGSSVHGIFQVRGLEWIVISFSRGSSRPRNQTWVSCIAGRRFTVWTTREAWVNSGTWWWTGKHGVLQSMRS